MRLGKMLSICNLEPYDFVGVKIAFIIIMKESKRNSWDEKYWTDRYEHEHTGWDIGYISTPLKEYFETLEDKDLQILIPGCGNAYEAKYLHENGFKNVDLIDLSEYPLKKFAKQNPTFPESSLMHKDFFALKKSYDLIIEQTFFCALDPSLREDYCIKMKSLLRPKGILAGLLFNIPLYTDHPPFGGNEMEYRKLFGKYFEIEIMEKAYNSIPPRMGNELFVRMRKT